MVTLYRQYQLGIIHSNAFEKCRRIQKIFRYGKSESLIGSFVVSVRRWPRLQNWIFKAWVWSDAGVQTSPGFGTLKTVTIHISDFSKRRRRLTVAFQDHGFRSSCEQMNHLDSKLNEASSYSPIIHLLIFTTYLYTH